MLSTQTRRVLRPVSLTTGCLWLLCAGLLTASPHPAAAASLAAYGELPSMEQLALSPDGNTLAYVTALDGERTVIIRDIVEKKILSAVKAGQQKLRGLTWAGNGHLLSRLR
jgi:hypothetical protein